MASLGLKPGGNGLEIATGTLAGGGNAEYQVENPDDFDAEFELWERTITFPPPGPVPPPPDFKQRLNLDGKPFFKEGDPPSQNVPLASLYQVLLYNKNEGRSDGKGNVLDQLNFPCVLAAEAGRADFLNKCADKPQVDITVGGTFVSLAFAASKRTMSRAQLVGKIPQLGFAGFPAVSERTVAATAHSVSTGPKLLHQLELSGKRMLPGDTFFFVILAWDSGGSWDFVWNPDATAPAAPPHQIITKQRFVDVRLTKLIYLDDSDTGIGEGSGEGNFTLVVQYKAPPAPPDTKTHSVPTFKSGTSLQIVPPEGQLTFGPEAVTAATRNVNVRVKGLEEDDGGFPTFDDDDEAETGATPLDFPTGEGKEEVTDRLLALTGNHTGGNDELRFMAEVLYSVKYS
jgi:hypothetical protein